MDNKKNGIPKLRFPGFTGAWEQRRFKDISKLSQGLQIAISKRFTHPGDGKLFYITNEFLNPNSTVKYYIDSPTKNVIAEKTDILMTRTGNTGKVVTDVEGVYHNNFFKISYNSSKIDRWFLYYLLNSYPIQREILVRAGNSTIPDLNHNDFYGIKIYIPTIEEQIKIGTFLTKVDSLIALHQRKLEHLQEQKKGLLQKMFPKNGETVPEVRFPGFTDAWEQRKLGDYLSIPTKEPITDINELKLMTLKLNLEGITLTANRETLKLGATKYYKRHEGQLLYGKQNFFHGSIALIPKEAEGYATSGDVPALDISNVNGKYLVDYISRPSYFKAKEALATGTGSKRIHEKTLLNFKITVPSLEEQNAISDFITNYTNLITLHQRKLDHLELMKKGLLQQMFV